MESCLFCRIVSGEIHGSIVHEGEHVVAFRDIDPQAPLHVLIVPRRHIRTLNDLRPEDDQLVGSLFRTAAKLATEFGYADRGYRTVFNTNADAGQTVPHIHLHLLAGRSMHWPPG
jgi:histidine triad (HIT) family protein